MPIGNSSGGATWQQYSAPYFYIDGSYAICIDARKNFPVNEPYHDQHIVYPDSSIANTTGSYSLSGAQLNGMILKVYELTNNLTDLTPTNNVKVFAAINAKFGNLNETTLRNYNDAFVNAILDAPPYNGTGYLYSPFDDGFQRLVLLGTSEQPAQTGKGIFQKRIIGCNATVNKPLVFTDYKIEILIDGVWNSYPMNQNGQTDNIEFYTGEYRWREALVNPNADGVFLTGKGIISITQNGQANVDVYNHEPLDRAKLLFNPPSPNETMNTIRKLWDEMRCKMEYANSCGVFDPKCIIGLVIDASWKSWLEWLCYFKSYFNYVKNWSGIIIDALMCLQSQITRLSRERLD